MVGVMFQSFALFSSISITEPLVKSAAIGDVPQLMQSVCPKGGDLTSPTVQASCAPLYLAVNVAVSVVADAPDGEVNVKLMLIRSVSVTPEQPPPLHEPAGLNVARLTGVV
jgi:hypothetical protein